MSGRMEFSFTSPGSQPRPRPRDPEGPFRILAIGDFSGRGSRGAHEGSDAVRARRTRAVDVDTFDSVLKALSPELHLTGHGLDEPGVTITIGDLDHFHPDHLFDHLDIFRSLQASRARLLDDATFAEEAARWKPDSGRPEPDSAVAGNPPKAESETDTLQRLLGARPASPESTKEARAKSGLDDFIRRIVAPDVTAGPDPRREELVGAVDLAVSEVMRRVLHHPEFQRTEAAWLSLRELITNLETGENLHVHCLDLSREELINDLAGNLDDLSGSAIHHHLVDRAGGTPGGDPWGVIVLDTAFGDDPGDPGILAALGAVASRGGAPVLAGAAPVLAGVESWDRAPDPRQWAALEDEAAGNWTALRRSPIAAWIGLACPRILLRLPYGGRGERISRFAFEEMGASRTHEAYLWGNPAWACARLLGESFLARGAEMEPGDHLDLGDLPSHIYDDGGEPAQQACAEAYLSDRAGDELLDRGLIPVLSLRHHNAVRVLRFHSLADPPAPLAGFGR